jgi:hypothetical protein
MNLYVIDADGGVPRRLTPQPSWDVMGTWSRDGRWIYFLSDRTGTRQIWKIPAEGGEAVQVTTGGGGYAEESWGGRHLYYTQSEPTGIWRTPVSGGKETQVLPESELIGRNPVVSRSGLYYLRQLAGADMSSTQGRRSGYGIDFFDFESGQVTKLFEDEDFAPGDDLAVSPDEEWILMARRTSVASAKSMGVSAYFSISATAVSSSGGRDVGAPSRAPREGWLAASWRCGRNGCSLLPSTPPEIESDGHIALSAGERHV